MKYIIGIISAIGGGILLEFEGAVIGFALGFLFGMIWELKRKFAHFQNRVDNLNRQLKEQTAATSKPSAAMAEKVPTAASSAEIQYGNADIDRKK